MLGNDIAFHKATSVRSITQKNRPLSFWSWPISLWDYLNLEYRLPQIMANQMGPDDHNASDWLQQPSNRTREWSCKKELQKRRSCKENNVLCKPGPAEQSRSAGSSNQKLISISIITSVIIENSLRLLVTFEVIITR